MKPIQPLPITALRLFNRRVEGAPAGVRELVVTLEIDGIAYEVITAMQGSPSIDDWTSADAVRDYIAAGCPREAVAS